MLPFKSPVLLAWGCTVVFLTACASTPAAAAPGPSAPAPAAADPEPAPAGSGARSAETVAQTVADPGPGVPAVAAPPKPNPPTPKQPEAPPAYKGPDPCKHAKKGSNPVVKACAEGGIRKAKTTMRTLVRQAKAAGVRFDCDDCHKNDEDYSQLERDAHDKFDKLLAAAQKK